MSISKNFVIKNGLDVSTDLILADATTRKVGIGTTAAQYTLHINGGIGVTNVYVSGITTVINELRVGTGGTIFSVIAGPTGFGQSVGVGTANPAFLLDIRSPVSTGQTALYVQGDVRVTGDLSVDDISITNLNVSGVSTFVGFATFSNNIFVAGIGTVTTLNSTSGTINNLVGTSGTITTLGSTNGNITNLTGTNVSYSGISTLGTVRISSGIITATSGIVTYFGDGNFLNLTSNPSRGIGIGTTGGLVGYAVTFIDFKGSGVSTAFYNSNTGIATIFFEGGGGGSGSIGIGSTFAPGAANGDLFYHIDYGRIFVYYDEVTLGIGTDEFWIDAAPFNVGIITSLTNVSFSPGSAISPSMFFVGDTQTGFFSPGNGQFTIVSTGSSVLNVNASGINVTGIATITNAAGTVKIGIGTTALLVEGNARVTGILTVGSSSITLNGSTNVINVGTGITLSSSGINVTGVITATSFSGNGSGLTGVAATTLTIGAGTTALPSISPTGDSNTGIFFPSADTIAFSEGGTEALRVDSSGRLLVGTSTTPTAGNGQHAKIVIQGYAPGTPIGGGYFSLQRGQAATGFGTNEQLGLINFGDNTGASFALIEGYSDGTPGANDYPGRLMFSTTADGSSSPTEAMRINNQREVLIGTATRTANGGVLQLSSGITFPATAVAASDANTLDDYEEGTCSFTVSASGGGTFSGYIQEVRYCKIGRQVTVSGFMQFAQSAASGDLTFAGLPFTLNNNTNGFSGGCAHGGGYQNSDQQYVLVVGGLQNTSNFYFNRPTDADSLSILTAANVNGSLNISQIYGILICYQVS